MTLSEYEVGSSVKLSVVFRTQDGALIDPAEVTLVVTRPDGTEDSVTSITNSGEGSYYAYYLILVEDDHTYKYTGSTAAIDFYEVSSGFFVAVDYTATDLDYLIPVLRFQLGDYDTRRYSTEVLRQALIFALKALMGRWGNRYEIDSLGTVTRGKASFLYDSTSPPIVQIKDEPPIVLQAAILIASGATQDASWQVASWRDDEIQVSNIQADKSRHAMLDKWINMLDAFFKLKLHTGLRQSLPGFKYPPNYREG